MKTKPNNQKLEELKTALELDIESYNKTLTDKVETESKLEAVKTSLAGLLSSKEEISEELNKLQSEFEIVSAESKSIEDELVNIYSDTLRNTPFTRIRKNGIGSFGFFQSKNSRSLG